jgi:plasmid stabilization system protein ParE
MQKIDEYLEEKASREVADKVEKALFDAFEELVRLRFVGYRRDDVRQKTLLFYTVFSYVIAFRREPQVVIVSVVHGARNLPKLL